MARDYREVIKNSQLFWRLSDEQIDKVNDLCHEEFWKASEESIPKSALLWIPASAGMILTNNLPEILTTWLVDS